MDKNYGVLKNNIGKILDSFKIVFGTNYTLLPKKKVIIII